MADPKQAFEAERRAQLEGRILLLSDTDTAILRMLKEAEDRISAILADQPSSAERWILPQLQAQVRQVMADFSDHAAASLGSGIGSAWQAGQDLIDVPLSAAGIYSAAPLLDTRQLLAMRAFSTDRIRDVGVQAINKINMQLGLAVIGAQTPSDAITEIKGILGESSRSRALMITRTSMSQGYSTASFERLLQQAEVVTDLKKQWRASGKAHPRHNHHIADGQIQDVNQPFNLGGVKLMYPHDPKADAKEVINCGCTMLPIMQRWEKAMANPGRKYDNEPTLQQLLARGG